MRVVDLLVQALVAEGVERVFGVPGEENEALLFAMKDSSITFVPTRHEQGAAFIANVWGRVTGQAGVCLSTLGPGATNLITGLADANLDKAPVVAITAQGSMSRLHHESHQALDVVDLLRPVTKYNTSIRDPAIVAEVVRKAFKVAEREKPGVTHIELSEDMAEAEVPHSSLVQRRRVRRPAPDYKALAEAERLLRKARRPLVLAGNGAIRQLASRHLTRLATTYNIPVITTFMGKGAISDRLPQSLRTVGLGFRDVVMDAIDQADLIVAVGFDVAELPPERLGPRGKRYLHIDFEPAEVYLHYQPEVELVCDISAALWQLQRRLGDGPLAREKNWWHDVRRAIDEDIRQDRLPDDADHLTVPGALHLIRHHLPDEGLLISDVGSHKRWIARNFPAYEPGSVIISNGAASMGIALPGAIAAKLARPDKPVIACMGDGGFMMNVQEIETARRLGTPFVCVVFNDDDYGLISWKQRRNQGRSTGTRIGNPRFDDLARAFDIPATKASTPAQLNEALSAALAANELRLIEVPVDPSVNDGLIQRLQQREPTESS